ncbi:MAG TPA: BlaI/MecI/CopY family transcriptional regulator [Gemmatimonadaceae bacterium]|nr:BlaI/MecI/CopY family transcriptional regulator [Gemmatimonadaceae bacterium]
MAGEFGDRELDVMGVLWEEGSATVAEMRDRLPVELAYTTVLTILRNLEGKGFVRHEEEGKAHRYFPRVERRAAGRNALARLIDRVFDGSPELLLTQLVSDHPLEPSEMRRLQALLDRRIEGEGAPPRGRKRGDSSNPDADRAARPTRASARKRRGGRE